MYTIVNREFRELQLLKDVDTLRLEYCKKLIFDSMIIMFHQLSHLVIPVPTNRKPIYDFDHSRKTDAPKQPPYTTNLNM